MTELKDKAFYITYINGLHEHISDLKKDYKMSPERKKKHITGIEEEIAQAQEEMNKL